MATTPSKSVPKLSDLTNKDKSVSEEEASKKPAVVEDMTNKDNKEKNDLLANEPHSKEEKDAQLEAAKNRQTQAISPDSLDKSQDKNDPVLEDDNTYAEEYQGNGVTDNFPVGWRDGAPIGATTMQRPAENASTVAKTVLETVYAAPNAFDDKGLGVNVDGVESVPASGAMESLSTTYSEQNKELNEKNDNK